MVNLMPRKHEGPSGIYLKAGVGVLVCKPSMREGGDGTEARGPQGLTSPSSRNSSGFSEEALAKGVRLAAIERTPYVNLWPPHEHTHTDRCAHMHTPHTHEK